MMLLALPRMGMSAICSSKCEAWPKLSEDKQEFEKEQEFLKDDKKLEKNFPGFALDSFVGIPDYLFHLP